MNREQSTPTVRRTGAEPQNPTVRLARMLVAQTLAYFAEHETKNLNLVRDRLMQLVDDKPTLGQGQNLRSAHLLLGKYAQQFNRGFQQTLADCLSEELATILPQHLQMGRSGASDSALDGMSLSLLDVGEVERVLLLDRIAQRFASRYDAVLEPLTQRLSVLFGHDKTSVHDNPFQPMVLLKAFASAWDKCELDPQASVDLVQSLDPGSWLDLTPLYTALNDTLVRAGVSAERAMRIKHGNSAHAPLGPRSGHAPLNSQPGTVEWRRSFCASALCIQRRTGFPRQRCPTLRLVLAGHRRPHGCRPCPAVFEPAGLWGAERRCGRWQRRGRQRASRRRCGQRDPGPAPTLPRPARR